MRATRVDDTDARLLLALADEPRATVLSLADTVGLSRNTVQSRLSRFDQHGVLASFERRIEPAALGYPLSAFIVATVTQQLLDEVAASLAGIPEVLEVFGLSGAKDLLVRVAARDGDDLYRIAGQILATPGVERTETSLVMRQLVDYRVSPLLRREIRPS
ncbi:Lrp/AsnC family transcriptional regulator [Frankia sp. AgB1.9]|uniref:Lrp/AsnC family transcriptional regulator n=1 Tax=unclassified Frankia TaxID=2632575 RepID=UPI001EE3AC9D|nr:MULTISPECIES: Lrp/AsnC family transcriptional regulator [unclassified Frankia]MBL7486828.1 Lrp/AsnC family transcriptional regulator [Frankia sp. AgW1.1]MBL7549799.1 Lrp/AsnC family transcriptional regulator [Frankia sp. AgB1.9]